jgi:K+-transporting ATPase ATPase C chain
MLRTQLLPALRTTAVTLVLTGLAYPLAVTGLAQLALPGRASGSLLQEGAQPIGSELLAQRFSAPVYFQPRPSAAGDAGYDASNSSGSNLGPTSKKLRERVQADLKRLHDENPEAPATVPAELVTQSGSGLDPHLSPSAALWQVPRVARARGMAAERLRALVEQNTEGRDLGFLGEPRVNVLLLNLALDRQVGRPSLPATPAAAPAAAPPTAAAASPSAPAAPGPGPQSPLPPAAP